MDDDGPPPPEPASMAWLLTFADLVSLLITFFVLLFSMKEVNEGQWAELVGIMDSMFSPRDPIVDTRPDAMETVEDVQRIEADNLTYIQNILITRFATDPILSRVRTNHDRQHDKLTVSLPSHMLFSSGSADLKSEGKKALKRLGDVMRHLDNGISVAGHTDPYPILSEEYPTNWELGMMRAVAVAKNIEGGGFVGHVPAVSYGDSRYGELPKGLPRAQRNAMARRVDVVVYGTK